MNNFVELTEFIVKNIVNDPDSVSVKEFESDEDNTVLIEIYTRYHDKMSVGDKIVNSASNKNILMNIYKDSEAPYTDYRPNEGIDIISSASAIDGRMVTSPFLNGALNKLLIELQRKCAEIYGKEPMMLHEIYDYYFNK